MSEVKIKDDLALRQGKNPDGTIFLFVSKQDIINRLIDVYGEYGKKWKIQTVDNTPQPIGEDTKDSVIVKGAIHILDGKEWYEATPVVTGAYPVIPGKVSTGEAMMKAENILLKRCASYLGVPVSDEAEPVEKAPANDTSTDEKKPEPVIATPTNVIDGNKLRVVKEVPITDHMPIHEEPASQQQEKPATSEPEVTERPVGPYESGDEKPTALPPVTKANPEIELQRKKLEALVQLAPGYETLKPYYDEIMTTKYEEYKDSDTIKKKLLNYGINHEWLSNGYVRISRARLMEAIDYCRVILKAGPVKIPLMAAAPVPVQAEVKKEILPVIAPAETVETIAEAVAQESALETHEPIPADAPLPLGIPSHTLDIGPANDRDFGVQGMMLDLIEKHASDLGISVDQFLKRKGVEKDEMTFLDTCTQGEFDALFV
jgi:hypothetical protein